MSAAVSQVLSRTLARELEADVPPALADTLSSDLGYFLTQSVTQAVVPALTYALHHSPAEDYFCTYCSAYKVYCELCRRAGPEQLQRSQLYAAYYSSFYAKAFAERSERAPAADIEPPPGW